MNNTILLNGSETVYTTGTLIKKENEYYLHGLAVENDFIEIQQEIPEDGYYQLEVCHFSEQESFHCLLIDNKYLGGIKVETVTQKDTLASDSFFVRKGTHTVKLLRSWGELTFYAMKLVPYTGTVRPHNPSFSLANPNATKEARALMDYFKSIYGKRIITGQHTNVECADVDYIKRVTGHFPALLGFDLMSYSAAIHTEPADWACMSEVSSCQYNVDCALHWAKEKKALITLCWHWYSPNYGRDKSFYTVNTDYNLGKVLEEKGKDYDLLIKDIDMIAEQLKRFQDNNIPVLWRPLHEADGGWFWWGASGAEAYKELYRTMYDRLTNLHGLNNLIWVVNSPKEGWYPGDDVVDLNCMDIYGPAGNDGPLLMEYGRGNNIPTTDKPIGLGEVGTVPNIDEVMKDAPWLWFMLWGGFTHNEKDNPKERLNQNFNSEYAVCLEEFASLNLY